MYTLSTVVLFLAALAVGNCHCPRNRIHNNSDSNKCDYEFTCFQDIGGSGFSLPYDCHGSSNLPVSIKVTLHNPTVFNESAAHVVKTLITSITSFQSYGRWPQENFAMIAQMYELSELHLNGNQINHIDGHSFTDLYKLKILDFSHNNLSDIEYLTKMRPSLLTLSLAYNSISNIPTGVFDSVLSLEELNLSYNSISSLNEESFRKLFRLKLLNLAYNNIDNIPDGAFDTITSLEELDLSNNSISNLKNSSFSGLTMLKTLKLNNNKIVNLDGAMNSLKSLKHLFLKGNQIQHIDMQSLHMIYHLETFDVSGNNIENIASNVFSRDWFHFHEPSRYKIILSNNFLTYIPKAISEYSPNHTQEVGARNFLETELDLSINSITSIEPDAFQYIVHLTSLDLSHNKLTTFVVDANDLKYIKHLNLSYNYIRSLNYDTFESMGYLENLDLSFNQLDMVPDFKLINSNVVRYLNMSANELADISSLRIKFHPIGGVLDLTNNSISTINIPPGETLRLMILILKSNYIEDTSLIELTEQKELKILDMSKNLIRELNDSSLHLPSSLEQLILSHNQITYIAPSVFKDLLNLHMLRLSHNHIQYIEYGAFRSLPELKHLDLSFNEIPVLDSKVFTNLKSLAVLSLRYNHMYDFDYKSWIGHRYTVTVNMDGNNFNCRWLASAVSDFNNGISVIKPSTTEPVTTGPNVKGISCDQNAPEALKDGLDSDRTLLVLVSKILEAVKEQSKMIKEDYQPPGLLSTGAFRNYVK